MNSTKKGNFGIFIRWTSQISLATIISKPISHGMKYTNISRL